MIEEVTTGNPVYNAGKYICNVFDLGLAQIYENT
jgi:hypothetical protein